MKNIVAILFIIFGFVKAWSANGDIFTVTTIEGIEMNFKVINESAKTCEVTQPAIPLETEGIVTIPETANGYQVVRIGQNAFENCSETNLFGTMTSSVIQRVSLRSFDR